jgi:hypothetical protein
LPADFAETWLLRESRSTLSSISFGIGAKKASAITRIAGLAATKDRAAVTAHW